MIRKNGHMLKLLLLVTGIVVGFALASSGAVAVEKTRFVGDRLETVPSSPVGGLRNLVLAQSVFELRPAAVLGIDEVGVLWAYPTDRAGKIGNPRALGTGFEGIDVYPADGTGIMPTRSGYVLSTRTLFGVNCYQDMYRYDLMYNKVDSNDRTVKIGMGWRTGFQIVPSADLTGDGDPDVLAVAPGSGDLRLYRFDGDRFRYPYPKVGYGWTDFRLLPAGDMTGDVMADLLAVARNGDLFLYPGKGDGTFSKKSKIGYGWQGLDVLSGADVDGDGVNDLMARNANGDLFFYKGLGGGRFAKKTLAGQGLGPVGLQRKCSGQPPATGTIIPMPWSARIFAIAL